MWICSHESYLGGGNVKKKAWYSLGSQSIQHLLGRQHKNYTKSGWLTHAQKPKESLQWALCQGILSSKAPTSNWQHWYQPPGKKLAHPSVSEKTLISANEYGPRTAKCQGAQTYKVSPQLKNFHDGNITRKMFKCLFQSIAKISIHVIHIYTCRQNSQTQNKINKSNICI